MENLQEGDQSPVAALNLTRSFLLVSLVLQSFRRVSCSLVLRQAHCPFFLLFVSMCSHLSRTASNSNLPYLKMANFRKASNAKSVFIGLQLFWPIRTGRTLQPWKCLEICKYQQTLTPPPRSTIGFAGNKFVYIHGQISVLSGNPLSVLTHKCAHPHCWLISVHIWTGRQVWNESSWVLFLCLKKHLMTKQPLSSPLSDTPFQVHIHHFYANEHNTEQDFTVFQSTCK